MHGLGRVARGVNQHIGTRCSWHSRTDQASFSFCWLLALCSLLLHPCLIYLRQVAVTDAIPAELLHCRWTDICQACMYDITIDVLGEFHHLSAWDPGIAIVHVPVSRPTLPAGCISIQRSTLPRTSLLRLEMALRWVWSEPRHGTIGTSPLACVVAHSVRRGKMMSYIPKSKKYTVIHLAANSDRPINIITDQMRILMSQHSWVRCHILSNADSLKDRLKLLQKFADIQFSWLQEGGNRRRRHSAGITKIGTCTERKTSHCLQTAATNPLGSAVYYWIFVCLNLCSFWDWWQLQQWRPTYTVYSAVWPDDLCACGKLFICTAPSDCMSSMVCSYWNITIKHHHPQPWDLGKAFWHLTCAIAVIDTVLLSNGGSSPCEASAISSSHSQAVNVLRHILCLWCRHLETLQIQQKEYTMLQPCWRRGSPM